MAGEGVAECADAGADLGLGKEDASGFHGVDRGLYRQDCENR
jgi:hypothetical protein